MGKGKPNQFICAVLTIAIIVILFLALKAKYDTFALEHPNWGILIEVWFFAILAMAFGVALVFFWKRWGYDIWVNVIIPFFKRH